LLHCLEGGLCNSIVLLWHRIEQDHCLHNFRDDDVSSHEALELSFISMMSIVGLAGEIFLEIAFLKLAKIAEGPDVLKAVCSASHTALAVNELFAKTATVRKTLKLNSLFFFIISAPESPNATPNALRPTMGIIFSCTQL